VDSWRGGGGRISPVKRARARARKTSGGLRDHQLTRFGGHGAAESAEQGAEEHGARAVHRDHDRGVRRKERGESDDDAFGGSCARPGGCGGGYLGPEGGAGGGKFLVWWLPGRVCCFRGKGRDAEEAASAPAFASAIGRAAERRRRRRRRRRGFAQPEQNLPRRLLSTHTHTQPPTQPNESSTAARPPASPLLHFRFGSASSPFPPLPRHGGITLREPLST
jgi:hypothetical protein